MPGLYKGYLHVRVEEEFIVASFIDVLGVLEFVSCVSAKLPIVLMAPEKIMRPIMVSLKALVISDMWHYNLN